MIGLTIRSGPADPRRAAHAFVADSAVITETTGQWGNAWGFLPASPPRHYVRIEASLTLDDMVADLVATEQREF